MQLSATVVVAALATVSFVCGALMCAIVCLMVGSARMKRMGREEQRRQAVMDGLSRSCDGIEATIAAVDTASINAGRLRNDVLKRIGAVERRLSQYADTLEKYYIAYITLRLESYRQIVAKLDGLVADMAKFGSATPTAAAQEEMSAAAETSPPAQPLPGAGPVLPPQEFQQQSPVAETASEPIAPDVNVGATMSFDVLGMEGAELSGEQPETFAAAAQEFSGQPVGGVQATVPDAETLAAPSLTDDALMYGQTMQFSMTDIEAARRNETTAPQPLAAEPQTPLAVSAPPEPQMPPPAFSPAVADEMGETIVFAVDDAVKPGVQEPSAPAIEKPLGDVTVAQEPPAPSLQTRQANAGDQEGESGMITGNDLMEQMDAFFNFK